MALSQVQCLDDNHVNPRTHESKPEFLYCEDQRLALETFLRDGREAFVKYLGARDLRGFLSDPELETLAEVVEPYDPGSELFFPEDGDGDGDGEGDEPPLSLHYWPELSDTSVPQMDLSWPDNVSYRGVTRTSVYTQPPLEGQVHIKEVVRKMIAQAQKVIAVVMDVFTDVDIFRDLLDAGFKRKVSVYIMLERSTLPHFQSMCQRANMHAGHLKNLRVRCSDGAEFYTRSCKKVRGRMGHRFMFIDGDKAVSGSYSFTWMSSRLDKNLITVVTGQAVEAFDRLFRVLYATSTSVDLRQVATEPQPELEPLPQPVPVAATSAAIARKLYSPKYAMLAQSNPSPAPEPKEAENLQNSKETKRERRKRVSKEAIQEDPPLHPGLTHLEKVCMMSYLPTWPEPDPPSDVIGFINIRDTRKPNQVHLQRSEMYETSQAIRFSSPFSMPKETLPEVATRRQVIAKPEQTSKLKPARDETKVEVSVVDGAQPTQLNAGPAEGKSKAEATGEKSPASDTTKTLNKENKKHSNTHNNQDAHTPPNTGSPSHGTQPVPGSNTTREAETNLNTQREVFYRGTQSPPTDSNTEPYTQTKTVSPSTDSNAQAVHAQPQTLRDNPPLTSSSTTPNGPLPSSAASPSSTSTPPVPKPRTIQLVIKDGVSGDGQKLPEFSVVKKPETITGVHNDPAVAAAVQPLPENEPETVPEPQSGSGRKKGAKKDADNTSGIGEQIPKAQVSSHIPERALRLHLPDTLVPDFRSPTPERESRSLSALMRTPTPDGFLPRTPTPDSQTNTPDRRTPTSDGYMSPRAGSALSANSEEYYECNYSPVFDRAASGTTEDYVSFTHTNTLNATTCAATLGFTNRSSSRSETESLSGPPSVSSLSSLKVKMREENVENGREEDEKGSVEERSSEGNYQVTERRGSEDAKRTADHFKQAKDPTETEEEHKEAQTQAPKRKRVLNQSAAEKPVDTGGTPGQLTNERTKPKRLSSGDLQPRNTSSERKTPDKEKAADRVALGPSGAERRDIYTDGQKLLHTPPRTPQGQQRDVRGSSPSQPSGPPQPLSINQAFGPRPWGSHQLNQAESKVLHGGLQSTDNTSSPRRPPSRLPPTTAGYVWSVDGLKEKEVSHSQQSPFSRQPPAAQGRTRAGHPFPKAEASLRPSQNQTASPQEAHRQEEKKAPFSFTFSRLYSVKGLKERVSKLPGQSKIGSASASGPGRKSTS
ncbi:protein FAM83G-like [Anoplopoma fimbria]|uniref:protein FAM83G-like n=1 Tax=Anoplopoma fimbria TaxID=229290 RepID=UPI0023ECE330|nr:protein FAM83G-like [Anoplopoma fimbria]